MPTVTFKDIVERARQHEAYWIEAALYHFTETIYGLMKDSGMNRSELAQKLGVSPAYITKLLRGDANVTIKTMVRLARVFGREVQIALPQQAESKGKMPVATEKQTERLEQQRSEYSQGAYRTFTLRVEKEPLSGRTADTEKHVSFHCAADYNYQAA